MKTYQFIANSDFKRAKDFFKCEGFSSNLIKSLSREMGQIKRNSTPIRMNEEVKCGDSICINVKEFEKNEIIPIFSNLKIFYEDDNYLVIFKDNGTATIPSFCNNENSLANYVVDYMSKNNDNDFIFRAYNRLDKETSGFVLICKDLVSYDLLLKHKNSIIKQYEVLTKNEIKEKIINKPIYTKINNDGRNELKRIIDSNGKPSITNILCTKYNHKLNISYAKIVLETGRTHQIRLHLSSINCPIIGDKLYGDCETDISNLTFTDTLCLKNWQKNLKDVHIENRMYLNCFYLKFYHPFKRQSITVENNLFEKIFNNLRD